MDVKLSQIIQDVAAIKKLLVDIVGDETRIKGSVEFENLQVKYAFPNNLRLRLPRNAQNIAIKGEGVDWAGEIRSKLLKLHQEK